MSLCETKHENRSITVKNTKVKLNTCLKRPVDNITYIEVHKTLLCQTKIEHTFENNKDRA